MTRRLVLVSLLALLALQLVPTASADAAGCSARGRENVALPTPAETFYLRFTTAPWGAFSSAQHAEVWRETNGIPGLQFAETHCADGRVVAEDWYYGEIVVPDPRSSIICC